jgi:hypothetical protein
MQRWEYLSVHVEKYHWSDRLGRRGDVPRAGRPYLPTVENAHNSGQLLHELGEQGWELVGIASGDAYQYRLFLKRPKS